MSEEPLPELPRLAGFERILVGVELVQREEVVSVGSQKAVEQAIQVARVCGSQITLGHSTWQDEVPEPISRGAILVHEGIPETGREALQALVERCTTAGVGCTLEIVPERPALAIIHTVLRKDIGLVIVGKRDATDGDSRKVGTTTIKLLRKCPCAVWAVKPDHDLAHKLVLAATDLSRVGHLAVRYGALVARQAEGELHVVHAYQVPMELQLQASTLSETEYARAIDEIRSAAGEHIEAQLEDLEDPPPLSIHVGRNAPSAAIREAVEHLGPDLLVMGTISRGGLSGLLVGNTAEKLLERVDCSLLTVKPEDFESPVKLPDSE